MHPSIIEADARAHDQILQGGRDYDLIGAASEVRRADADSLQIMTRAVQIRQGDCAETTRQSPLS